MPPQPALSFLMQREWLITNGLGGYAMGARNGSCRQTHHALLVLPVRPPLQRVVFVRQLQEALHINGNWEQLSDYNAFSSTLSRAQIEFLMIGGMVHFKIFFEKIALFKYLWMPQNGQGLFVRYEVIEGQSARLRIVPQVCFRDLETGNPLAESYLVRTEPGRILIYNDPNEKPCTISADRAGVLYPVNSWKTLPLFDPSANDWQLEEVYLPYAFEFDLQPGENLTLMLQLENGTRLDTASEAIDADAAFTAEIKRLRKLAHALHQAFSYQPIRNLATVAPQFIIARATAMAQNQPTILAGYPRLPDRGRETMIALPGLLLTTKQFGLAKEVFAHFMKHLHHGLIPHYFSSRPEAPNYTSLDATLWMFVAIYEYWQASHDRAYIAEIYPSLLEILQSYMRGVPHCGVKLDADDGLLFSVERRYPLTWMNAQTGDWQATPRHGKAVEVQALWHNALRIMAEFAEMLSKAEGFNRCNEYAERAAKSLAQKFWCESASYLFDCLLDTSIINAGSSSHLLDKNAQSGRGDNGILVGDPTLRPNQVIAIGLPFNVFSPEQTRAIIEVAMKKLVTPFGLRTLSPDHPAYCGESAGSPRQLAAARHNGCVHPWLVLFFTRACMRLHENPNALFKIFEPLFGNAEKHCAGHLAEMYDGDFPHTPRGASAFAASTGAVLQSWQIMQGKAF